MNNKKKDPFSMFGKLALITGSSGLLGVTHASALLESGASVVMTDINDKGLIKAYDTLLNSDNKGRIFYKIMDVTSKESIQKVSRELINDGLQVNVLVNNAAIDPKVQKNSVIETSRLENFLVDDWDFQLKVGLTGAMLCSQIFGQEMAKMGEGVILNIASDLSVFAPDQRLYKKDGLQPDQQPVKPVTYSVIKHGLVGLTKYTATYWADRGVRCNALSPGGVFNGQGDDFVRKLTQLIPMGRMATKDEYRGAVQFLCSDASAYMNGQNIIMDGGRSVL
jgi:NAD(P)-dependent dehydrogenase (short-subunit alcohol dehydrogenase family)